MAKKKEPPVTTAQEIRIRLARDVIAQLAMARFIAEPGQYVRLEGEEVPHLSNYVESDEKLDAQDVVRKAEICHVCAKGSLLIAAIDRFNKLKIGGIYDLERIASCVGQGTGAGYLKKYFPIKMLHVIENVFEGAPGGVHTVPDNAERAAIDNWNSIYDDLSDSDRLDAIMRNIVSNGGEFDMNKVPRPRKKATRRRWS